MEPTIELITECLICKSNNNSYQDNIGNNFRYFFQKRPVS